jgi:hypothetical protein
MVQINPDGRLSGKLLPLQNFKKKKKQYFQYCCALWGVLFVG